MGANDAELLSPMEIDAIGEILNISLGSSATSVSQLLGQQVNITTPEVKLMKTKEFDIKLYEPAIGVEINYVEGLSGSNILILKEEDVKVIVGLLLQTDFSDKEFVMDEMNIGAICEVMNQMMGAAATALSQFLNRTINISPPNSFPVANSEQFREKYLKNSEDVVAVYFDLIIGDMVKSKFINLMRVDLAKELVSNFGLGDMGGTAAAPAPGYSVTNAVYPDFDSQNVKLTHGESNNLNMIMSVPLQITVEIGRTTKKIKEILDFSSGTIVELNRQAGSQVDVFVNGKAIAKGNVVVVDDNYGVRITEVMNSEIMKLL